MKSAVSLNVVSSILSLNILGCHLTREIRWYWSIGRAIYVNLDKVCKLC